MRVLTAWDAVSPAIQRTNRYLFRPFKWGTFLKIAAVAALTEGTAANFNFTMNTGSAQEPSQSLLPPFSFSGGWIAAIVATALVSFALGIWIFYLVTRLRFALFHCLVNKTKEIRPGWALYRVQAMRFFRLQLSMWLGMAVAAVLVVLRFLPAVLKIWRSARQGEQVNSGGVLVLFFLLFAVVFVLALLFAIVDTTMRDFMLPHMALEDVPASVAWTTVRGFIDREPGSYCFYLFLRLALPTAAALGLLTLAALPMLIVLGTLSLSAAGFNAALEDATGAAALLRIGLDALFGLMAMGFALFVAVCLGGPLGVCVRNYALLFYGGRYPALGNLLSPPPPQLQPAPAAGLEQNG